MALTINLEADQNGPIYVERTTTGGASIQFFGGEFYSKEVPNEIGNGYYERVTFSARLFRGQPSTAGILSAVPHKTTEEPSKGSGK